MKMANLLIPTCLAFFCMVFVGVECLSTKNLKCTTDNLLIPVPENPHEFALCSSNGRVLNTYTCPSGSLFDSELQSCTRSSSHHERLPRDTKSACTEVGYICSNCSLLLFCNSDFQSIFQTPCGIGEACSNEVGACIPVGQVPNCFTPTKTGCTSSGRFPDPYSCQVYHSCTDIGNHDLIEEIKYCPHGSQFDSKLDACYGLATCNEPVACDGVSEGSFAYTPNNNYFYTCLYGNLYPIFFQCPENYLFSATSKRCEFVCNSPGFYPVAGNSTEFHICSVVNGDQNILETDVCPTGSAFNPKTSMCSAEALQSVQP